MKQEYVQLSETDQTYLENLIKKDSLPAKTYKQALALLELDQSRTFTDVAKTVGVVVQTVSTWTKNISNLV